jgi:hypothetical protein
LHVIYAVLQDPRPSDHSFGHVEVPNTFSLKQIAASNAARSLGKKAMEVRKTEDSDKHEGIPLTNVKAVLPR